MYTTISIIISGQFIDLISHPGDLGGKMQYLDTGDGHPQKWQEDNKGRNKWNTFALLYIQDAVIIVQKQANAVFFPQSH